MAPVTSLASAVVLFAGAAAAKGHGSHDSDGHVCKPLAEVVASNPRLMSFAGLAHAAHMPLPSMADGVKRTLFAPVNSAHMPDGVADGLLDDMASLRTMLEGHVVVDGALTSADLVDGMALHTAAGSSLSLDVSDVDGRHEVVVHAPHGGVSAMVVRSDLHACDTVIHLIDALLVDGKVHSTMEMEHAKEMLRAEKEMMHELEMMHDKETMESDKDTMHDDIMKHGDEETMHSEKEMMHGDDDMMHHFLTLPIDNGMYGSDMITASPGAYGDVALEPPMKMPMHHMPHDDVVTRTPGAYSDVALEPPAEGVYGVYVDGNGVYGGAAVDTAADDMLEAALEEAALDGTDEDGLEDMTQGGDTSTGAGSRSAGPVTVEGDSSTSTAGALIAGTVAAGVVAALAGVAAVVIGKKRAAAGGASASEASAMTV